MDTAAAALLYALPYLAALALLAWWLRDRERRRRPRDLLAERGLGHEVVVHTLRPDDQSVRGVLIAASPTFLELARPRYVHPDGEEAALAGAVLVPRERVAWAQVFGPAAGVLELERAAPEHRTLPDSDSRSPV